MASGESDIMQRRQAGSRHRMHRPNACLPLNIRSLSSHAVSIALKVRSAQTVGVVVGWMLYLLYVSCLSGGPEQVQGPSVLSWRAIHLFRQTACSFQASSQIQPQLNPPDCLPCCLRAKILNLTTSGQAVRPPRTSTLPILLGHVRS
jgi:hypothetical protein